MQRTLTTGCAVCWQVTIVREYAQGPNALMYCLPTGAFDPKRHANLQECAERELSEEVHISSVVCAVLSIL
jgi:ADP-ribose pyrophosphatase YjhB (NUDIX family)